MQGSCRLLFIPSLVVAAIGTVASCAVLRPPAPETPEAVTRAVCGRCHAFQVADRCVAGDCTHPGTRRTPPRAWPLTISWMQESLGCAMTHGQKNIITDYLTARFPGPVYPITWTEVAKTTGGWNIVSLRAFHSASGGSLYASTEGGGRILRSPDGTGWTEVAATGQLTVYGLTVFQDSLYAGTHSPEPQVWESPDGLGWSRIGRLPVEQKGIISMTVFRDVLYAGTAGARIYRSADGKTWAEMAALKGSVPAVWENWTRFLIEFQGHLYAGLEGGGVYRSPDGNEWQEVGQAITQGVRGVAVYQDALYVGTTTGAEIWRTRDGLQWERVLAFPSGGYVGSLTPFRGFLYAGIKTGHTAGDIFRSSDGVQWEEAGDISPKTVEALTVFGPYLYAGTSTPPHTRIFRTSGLLDE